MDHKKELEDLHKKSLEKMDEYMKTKGEIGEADHAKLTRAKKEWQDAWTKFMEVLMYLEKFEL